MTESLIAPLPTPQGAVDDVAPPGSEDRAASDSAPSSVAAAALIYRGTEAEVAQTEEAEAEAPAEEAAPVAYEPFALPQGVEIDTAALEEAQSLFAEARLSQPQAQKLVDLGARREQHRGAHRIDLVRSDPRHVAACARLDGMVAVWNTHNRVSVAGVISSSVSTWSAASGTRAFAASATFRATLVSGLAEDASAGAAQDYLSFDGVTSVGVAIGFRSLAPLGAAQGFYYNGNGWSSSVNVHAKTNPFLGLGYWVGLENCTNYTSSFVNNSGGSTYVAYDWRY